MIRTRKTIVRTLLVLAAWYALVYFRPSVGHPQRALPVQVRHNLQYLSRSGLPPDEVRKEIARFSWRDQFNRYEVHVEDSTNHGWILTAQPERESVGQPLWIKALLLDFHRYDYPAFRIQSGDEQVEINR